VTAALRSVLLASQRVENAVRRIDAIEVFRYFAAQKSPSRGMIRIALDLRGLAEVVHGDEDTASVGTIVRAGSVDGAGHVYIDCRTFRADSKSSKESMAPDDETNVGDCWHGRC